MGHLSAKDALTKINNMLDEAIHSNYLFPDDKRRILEAIDTALNPLQARHRVLEHLKGTGIPSMFVNKYFESKVGPLLDALDYA